MVANLNVIKIKSENDLNNLLKNSNTPELIKEIAKLNNSILFKEYLDELFDLKEMEIDLFSNLIFSLNIINDKDYAMKIQYTYPTDNKNINKLILWLRCKDKIDYKNLVEYFLKFV